jgi:transcriptional regulator with XRE-family HTH domain
MPSRGNPGRKARARSASEKLWMNEFSIQLDSLLSKPGWTRERVMKELGVSSASLYNYKNEEDLPSFDLLKRAHEKLGFSFSYTDFKFTPRSKRRTRNRFDQQPILPFIESVQRDDIQVVGKKTVGRDTLELTVQIRFAG